MQFQAAMIINTKQSVLICSSDSLPPTQNRHTQKKFVQKYYACDKVH